MTRRSRRRGRITVADAIIEISEMEKAKQSLEDEAIEKLFGDGIITKRVQIKFGKK